MKKIKFKVSSWKKGWELMKEISDFMNSSIKSIDEDSYIENTDFSIRFHPDDRKFGIILCKIYNDDHVALLNAVFSKYRE